MGILDRLLESAAAKRALSEGAESVERGLIPQAERGLVTQSEKGLVPMAESAEQRVLRDVTPIQTSNPALPPGAMAPEVAAAQDSSKNALKDFLMNNKGKLMVGGAGLAGLAAKYGGGGDVPPAEAQQVMNSPLMQKPVAPTEEKQPLPVMRKPASKAMPSSPAQKVESEDTSSFSPEDVEKVQVPDVAPVAPGENVASVQALKEAQDQAKVMRLISGLQEAGSIFADGQSLQKHDDTAYQHHLAMADQGVKDLNAQIEMQQKDPASAYSQGLRDYIHKSFGYAVPENIGGEDLKSTFLKPIADKYESEVKQKQFDTKMSQDQTQFDATLEQGDRKLEQQAKDRAEVRASRMQSATEKYGQKQAMADDRDLIKLSKEIDPYKASSRSPFGVAAKTAMAVQNVKALLAGEVDYNNLDTRQIVETAKVLDRILSQGSPTISGTEHLTPETAKMKIAHLMEYATSKRNGAGAGDFVKTMDSTFDREYKTAKKQLIASQKTTMRGYKGLSDRRREDVDDLIQQATGFSPDELRETDAVSEGRGAPKQPPAAGHSTSKVRVTNGKETLEIDPSDLQHALTDGYKQVK